MLIKLYRGRIPTTHHQLALLSTMHVISNSVLAQECNHCRQCIEGSSKEGAVLLIVDEAHPRLLLLGIEVQIEMPDEPVTHRCPQLQRGPQEGSENFPGDWIPGLGLICHDWVPGSVVHKPASQYRFKMSSELTRQNCIYQGGHNNAVEYRCKFSLRASCSSAVAPPV